MGREEELAAIGRLLDDETCRLLTLTGPGGIGKTRLALQAAADRLDIFADGVCLAALADLPSADLLVGELAAALGIDLGASTEPRALLIEQLSKRELLLVLDNFEHLLAEASLLSEIVAGAPDVTLLVTSRERLNLHGEWVYSVAGLPLPACSDQGDLPLAQLATNDAVQLFVQSARRARADFALTASNAEDVAQICRLTAGMPLAIELAASWSRALSCAELVQELEHSVAFLSAAARDGPERHRSLAAVFEHSWQRLAGDEQRALRQIAVFGGGFRREAAREICGTTLQTLKELVDRSLLRHSLEGRYELHELIRQYAAQKLALAGDDAQLRRRHATYFRTLAEQAEPELLGPEQQRWLARLDEEHDNLRAALHSTLDGGETEVALAIGGALPRYWATRGFFDEGRRWLERALAHPDSDAAPVEPRLRALNAAGTLARLQGDLARAQVHLEACLTISRASEARRWSAVALNALGLLARRQGDSQRAARLYEESIALSRAAGDRRTLINAISNLAGVMNAQGDHARAAELFEESLAFSREAGDQLGIAADLNNLANAVFDLGDYPRAWALYQESLELYRAGGDLYGASLALYNLGDLAHREGRLDQARAYLCEGLAIALSQHNRLACAEYLEKLATLAASRNDPEQAARLWGAAEREREALGAARAPEHSETHETEVGAARAAVRAETFSTAWAAGRALALEDVVADVLSQGK